MKKSEIKISVTLDEHHIPEKLEWFADDANQQGEVKAAILSLWDSSKKETLRIDLWTKDMLVDEMKMFIHQTFLTMADTYEKATGEQETANEIRKFTERFAELSKIGSAH
ncbi:MAG: gliding motility protein GldC [Bacteroidetes bacterium]|nr:MAG: gliding motility protein GldC [Bacteroidota bacterium]